MSTLDTEAIVLRAIRYSEADNVIALFTRDHGRLSAMVKGARRPRSRLGGRLQPAVHAEISLHRGRSGMCTVRGAAVRNAHAGLWVDAGRLQSAACVLEAILRLLPEEEPSDEAWNLLVRTLDLLAHASPRGGPARLHPLVLAMQAKLLLVIGILPEVGCCVNCGTPDPLVGFSARSGGALCPRCAREGEPLSPEDLAALRHLIGHPLAEADRGIGQPSCAGVERLLAQTMQEHLGVRLRSATPL